jgi:hypothetical protein
MPYWMVPDCYGYSSWAFDPLPRVCRQLLQGPFQDWLVFCGFSQKIDRHANNDWRIFCWRWDFSVQ